MKDLTSIQNALESLGVVVASEKDYLSAMLPGIPPVSYHAHVSLLQEERCSTVQVTGGTDGLSLMLTREGDNLLLAAYSDFENRKFSIKINLPLEVLDFLSKP